MSWYRKYLVFVFIVLFSCAKEGKPIDASTAPPDIEVNDLPYLRVTTNETIQNEPKVPGVLTVFERNELTFNSTIGIEYRGSTF